MNYRQSKKMFKQKVYGLKDNDYIIMEYDINKINPQMLDFIYNMLHKKLKKDNFIMIPNAISIKSSWFLSVMIYLSMIFLMRVVKISMSLMALWFLYKNKPSTTLSNACILINSSKFCW